MGDKSAVIHVKILSLGDPERYALRRLVVSAENELLHAHPDLQVCITEVDTAGEIGKYARVLVLPTLVIDEKVVSSGPLPTREEVLAWLHAAV